MQYGRDLLQIISEDHLLKYSLQSIQSLHVKTGHSLDSEERAN